MKYIARGINLDEEVWEALKHLKAQYGTYNKALRVKLLKVKPKKLKK